MKNNIFFLVIVLLSYSCNDTAENTKIEQQYKLALDLRKDKDFMSSINIFESLFTQHPNSKYAPMSMYQIGDIYLNDIKNYELALEKFNNVNEKFPNSESGKISLFLCGYISNNYLQEFSDAFIYYNRFKEAYPNDSLIFSVDYELYDPMTGLNNHIRVIDSLNSTN